MANTNDNWKLTPPCINCIAKLCNKDEGICASVVYNKLQAAKLFLTLTSSNTQYPDACNPAANVHEYVLSYIVMAA